MVNRVDSHEFGESLPQQIYKLILKKIIAKEIKAGEKIVEEDIARELNTSRAPVREALYLLQVDGIVERLPRRGTVVKSFSQKEIEEYNQVAKELLHIAVDYSRGNWTEPNRERLAIYAKQVQEAYERKDVMEYETVAGYMLLFIVHAADNKALVRLYETAMHILDVFVQVRWDEESMRSFHARLSDVPVAILESDFDRAKESIGEAMKQGIR
ncbi:GntR family transcriptional regulator [Cohnella thailandensis]|uniref:GntR family transcriptional regulator n=1 Tax=Cohnella thailandensis TaxID=557557 RepID=A0A841T4F0_9BACL|nr:GntR family transcriptional regulator [Cohnella thailandensis]MBB6637716.1 GntR family transcriptional regulator [Cohnella thailandensis]MBP1974107.1 DNA-binding GntR family transcriptional regulator [Cohnella thailandensis]